jgi:hypothetical protein
VSDILRASVTLTVNVYSPTESGVPDNTPLELREKWGIVPDVISQLSAPEPPDASSCWLYASPTVPFGKVVVVIEQFAAFASVVYPKLNSAHINPIRTTLDNTFIVFFIILLS